MDDASTLLRFNDLTAVRSSRLLIVFIMTRRPTLFIFFFCSCIFCIYSYCHAIPCSILSLYANVFARAHENERERVIKRNWTICMNIIKRVTRMYMDKCSKVNMDTVTCNLIRAIDCSDKWRNVRVCNVRYDVYSNSFFSGWIASLIGRLFYIRVHEVKLDRTE
jgi:hypothetical protein